MKNPISSTIKSIRFTKDLTQESLAEELGVSAAHISTLEQGKTCPSYRLMGKIIEKYNVDANAFFAQPEETAELVSTSVIRMLREKTSEVHEPEKLYLTVINQLSNELKEFKKTAGFSEENLPKNNR